MLEQMEKRLLPCPFCGSIEVELDLVSLCSKRYSIVCRWCRALGPRHSTEEDTVESWNRRSLVNEEKSDA